MVDDLKEFGEMMAKPPRWFPVSSIDRVIDGDTLVLLADAGFGIFAKLKVRMARIDAPELNTPEGVLSKMEMRRIVEQVGTAGFDIQCYGQDKYGRWLCELLVRISGANVNDMVVRGGFAKSV